MQKKKHEIFEWQQIETRDSVAYGLFKKHFLKRKLPVIITNSAPQWSAFKNWTPGYLKQKLGNKMVIPDADYYQIVSKVGESYPFDKLMELIEASSENAPSPYLRNIDIHSNLPELVEDINPRLSYALPNWLTCKLVPQVVTDGLVELFLGGRGTSFPILHFDSHGSNAFITQIYGKKDVILFSPAQTELLHSLFGDPGEFSVEKLENAVVGNSPIAAQLIGYKQTLLPGDTVFIPSGWWHTTIMNELSITISTNNVNQSNWLPFIRSMTSYNRGAKKALKTIYFLSIGGILWTLDLLRKSDLISRPIK